MSLLLRAPAGRRPLDGAAALRAGPGDDDDDEETPIGDPDDDDEGDDWDDDDDDDEETIQVAPRPPKGPGDAEDDELPMGDPPDDDPTDDPDDEDEGEGDDEPLQSCRLTASCSREAGRRAAGSGSARRAARPAHSPSARIACR